MCVCVRIRSGMCVGVCVGEDMCGIYLSVGAWGQRGYVSLQSYRVVD